MRRSQSILALTVLCVTVISLLAAARSIDRSIRIPAGKQFWVSDSSNPNAPEEHDFLVGQTVYIHWINIAEDVTIEVYKPDKSGVMDHDFTAAAPAGVEDFVPQSGVGKYTVWVGPFEKECTLNVDSFFVVPEVLFGSLGAVGAALAAGLVYYRRKRR